MARPKGYAHWNPQPHVLALVEAVQHVLHEYEDHLPLTARQVFYRLVGTFNYDKTEQAYARLCEALVRARRAQMIPFDSIRDDGTVEAIRQTHLDVTTFWQHVEEQKKYYNRFRQAGQECRIELWCEAAGMVPQLRRVAWPYSVPVYSTGGFASVTVTYEIAQRALEHRGPTVFLHVGDYDPSGESIFESMTLDARSFLVQEVFWREEEEGGEDARRELVEFFTQEDGVMPTDGTYMGEPYSDLIAERVALTQEQVDEYELETAPPKRSDSRSRKWEREGRFETTQAEAMPPDVLARTVREAIQSHLDLDRFERETEMEAEDKDALDHVLDYARAQDDPNPSDER